MKKIVILFYLLLSFPAYCIDVVFIDPTIDNSPFWKQVIDVAEPAAKNLNIQLKIYNSGGHRLYQKKTINQIINQKNKPDYLIFLPFDGTVVDTFTKLEQAKIPFITLERPIFSDVQELLGQPRGKYKFWLGEIYHDNKSAGQLLAKALISASKSTQPSSDISNVIGITGGFSGQSNRRNAGLISELEQHTNDFYLAQIINAHWQRKLASDKFNGLLQRYNDIVIAWTAADIMALGVADIAKTRGKIINENLFIGGFDWAPEALQAIKNDEYTASVGGHFMQVAWALVKIYDHANGKPSFAINLNKPSYQLQLIDRNNIDNYQVLFNNPDWSKVDYRQFTLSDNTNLTRYQFDFSRILAQLSQ